jgi:hypothetical protein
MIRSAIPDASSYRFALKLSDRLPILTSIAERKDNEVNTGFVLSVISPKSWVFR